MLGQPDQHKGSIKCKRCHKVGVVINTRDHDQECKDLGRCCTEPTDKGERGAYTKGIKTFSMKTEKDYVNTQRSGKGGR